MLELELDSPSSNRASLVLFSSIHFFRFVYNCCSYLVSNMERTSGCLRGGVINGTEVA
jgi:hypothetical protein